MENKINLFEQKNRRRNLRKSQTIPEQLLWAGLRRKITGYKFYRQFSIGDFIVDFCCQHLKLVVEIDGGYHEFDGVYVRDIKRQRKIESLGFKFLRYTNNQVRKERESVWQDIVNHCQEREKELYHSPS